MSIFVAIVLMAISYALMPKPKVTNAAIQEGQVTTANASDPIPIIFGEVEVDGANLVWWGDPQTKPIYSDGGGK